MYTLKTSASLDSAHFLAGYPGKCSRLHGHHWEVEAVFYGEALQSSGDERGMLLDFHTLKTALGHLCDKYDHTFLYETGTIAPALEEMLEQAGFSLTPLPFRPTAEHLAQHFYEQLVGENLPVLSVTVYETPKNAATYRENKT